MLNEACRFTDITSARFMRLIPFPSRATAGIVTMKDCFVMDNQSREGDLPMHTGLDMFHRRILSSPLASWEVANSRRLLQRVWRILGSMGRTCSVYIMTCWASYQTPQAKKLYSESPKMLLRARSLEWSSMGCLASRGHIHY